MKKYIALIPALLLVLLLAGCGETATLDENYTYDAKGDIHSLDIQIGAAEFTIQHADKIAIKSNLKYLDILEKNGVLTIIDRKTVGVTYDSPVLTIYMPVDMTFESIHILVGAASMTADTLSAKTLKLQLGAGDVSISNISVETGADIEGGAGKITVDGGMINNLELEMGVGELNLRAALLGNNDLTLGVGESNLILLGNRGDYEVEIEKGIGSITVDGKTATDFGSSGNGESRVQIQGGVGAIHLTFQEADNG